MKQLSLLHNHMHFTYQMGTHAHTHTSSFIQILKRKEINPTYCIRGDAPWRILSEVIYCLAQLKLKKKKAHDFGAFSRYPPFKTTQAKIFTKVRHSQTTLGVGGGRNQKKIYERDWRPHHNKFSALIVSMKMSFRIGQVEHAANTSFGSEKSKSFIFVFRSGWYTALSPFGGFLLKPSKKKLTIQTNTAKWFTIKYLQ